jgi:hypothetical protein
MKKYNNISISLLILFFIGCEISPEKAITSKNESFYDQEDFIENINTDLDLNRSQEEIIRGKLGDSKDFHPYSSSIWRLAASLYEVLSEEQIENLLSGSKKTLENEKKPSYGKGDDGSKNKDFSDLKFKFLYDIIDDNQESEITSLKDRFLQLQDSLKLELADQNISEEELKSNVFALKNYFKTSLKNILTDKQKSELEAKYNESKKNKIDFELQSKKTDDLEEEKLIILEITEDQNSQLQELDLAFKDDLDKLNNEFIENSTNDNLYINSAAILMQNYHISKSKVLTEKQNTIINIHDALIIRFHEKYKNSKKG